MMKYPPHILIISFVCIAIPITSATGGSITLRSSYKKLSVSQVHSMANVSIREKEDWGFYGHSTIKHGYNPKAIRGDKVVVDDATGLMWHQGGSDDWMKWDDAKEWVEDLNSEEGYAGYHDWRLPTLEEAASLLESSKKNGNLYIDQAFSKEQKEIWTGDKCDYVSKDYVSKDVLETAWYVDFSFGKVSRYYRYNPCFVRPVRSVR